MKNKNILVQVVLTQENILNLNRLITWHIEEISEAEWWMEESTAENREKYAQLLVTLQQAKIYKGRGK